MRRYIFEEEEDDKIGWEKGKKLSTLFGWVVY